MTTQPLGSSRQPHRVLAPQALPAGYVVGLLYAGAVLMAVDQVGQLLLSLRPFRPDEVPWRFGAVGLGTGRLTPLVFADLIFVAAAFLGAHRRVVLSWGVVHLGIAGALVACLFAFGLDAVEMRRSVQLSDQTAFHLAAGRVAFTLALAFGYSILAGLAALRAARRHKGLRDRDELPLVVGH